MLRNYRFILGLSAAFLLLSAPAAQAAEKHTASSAVKQAAEFYAQGKIQEAAELSEKAAAEQPSDWLSRAALSFYAWQQGDIIKAVDEGSKAVELAPSNYIAVLNLALVKEGLEDLTGAIPLYEKARTIDPNNYVPVIGIARCQIKLGKETEGLQTLQEMSAANGKEFDWYYELADTYLRINKISLASPVAAKAMPLAKTPEQKSQARMLAMLAFIQNNQLKEAAALKDDVFNKSTPRDYELYIRTLSGLVPETDPESAKRLLEIARTNLFTEEDSEGFYRMGRVAEEKAEKCKGDSAKYEAWLANAEIAYRRAISLFTGQSFQRAKFYMGLASVLDQQGKLEELSKALGSAIAINRFDTLAPFLRSQLEHAKPDAKHCPIQLDNVSFKIDNLNCNCQISKVEDTLNHVDGVAFARILSTSNPYEGMILIDQSKTAVKDAFAQTTEKIKALYATLKTPISPNFIQISSTPISSATAAIALEQQTQNGAATAFFNSFKAVVPFEPLTLERRRLAGL